MKNNAQINIWQLRMGLLCVNLAKSSIERAFWFAVASYKRLVVCEPGLENGHRPTDQGSQSEPCGLFIVIHIS